MVGGATNKLGARFLIDVYKLSGQISHPTLQPVKRKYFEKLLIIIDSVLYLKKFSVFS